MNDLPYNIVTGKDRDDLLQVNSSVVAPEWPEFMLNDFVANKYWEMLYLDFPQYQFVLVDPKTEDIMASCNSIPLFWEGDFQDLPDEGWDWALSRGFQDLAAGRKPTIQCALSITVPKKYRKLGISTHSILVMKAIGKKHGLSNLIAPVRPIFKHRYPHTPMDRYLKWKNTEGIPLDKWLGVHAKLGGEIVKVCYQSMKIVGTVTQWEEWTKKRFPGSDKYIVPGALVPVKIDWDRDRGTYIEPNVWMVHSLT
jgi:hypothetical protein